jgi:pimeloyl-ACP methyl ester carboxylesterase
MDRTNRPTPLDSMPRRPEIRRLAAVLLLMTWLVASQSAAAESGAYFYPFVNPYQATVLGLPRALEVPLPPAIPTREFTLQVFPERKIPEVFWYEEGLVCSLAYQERRAPLVFLVPGAGSRYDSPIMVKFQKLLHQAGFHVVALSSPIHMDFVVNASSVRARIEVSSIALVGYSLGAFNAAFVSRLDDEQRRLNFRKVLLVNPPVDLYGSVSALDRLLVENIPGGQDGFDAWLRVALARLVALRSELGHTALSGDFLYEAYKRVEPKEQDLAAVIGLVFRMSAADMIFTADVMNGGGYIVPKNAQLTNSTSLTRFAMVAYRTRFTDYFDEWFFPDRQRREPGLTREALLARLSLRSLEPYLKTADKIGLIHNEDDVILAPGEIEYLQAVFGARARIFPTGGHMGNAFHPEVVRAMLDLLGAQRRD